MKPPVASDQLVLPDLVREHTKRKSHGVHYTPIALAAFVARRVLAQLPRREVVVLDPACGDGELLVALAVEARRAGRPAPRLVGIDRDADAVATAEERLRAAPTSGVSLSCADFLEAQPPGRAADEVYDAVISNPPYVRTQVLGAARAQALGRQFGLTGRVDLYHAFVAAMTLELAGEGVLGLLCSNRFLTTKGGQSLRALLDQEYELAELWDLGDSKLFEAAVLPVVVVGRRAGGPTTRVADFVRVYEEEATRDSVPEVSSLLEAMEGDGEGVVAEGQRHFRIERGLLSQASPDRPWNLTSPGGARWLAAVRNKAAGCLRDVGPIRVGIKTTADAVFIRETWDDIPEDFRPEPDLLHPLLTHRVAERWSAHSAAGTGRRVLYPHTTVNGRRRAVDLSSHPKAGAYLEQHRERLEGREYVRKSGRAWYEIWVPQRPEAWAAPKLVWPDISEQPRFFLDDTGSIVNGDCYWLSCPDTSYEELALVLAVANSSVALQHYDLCCGNRLYAGRRRFITQYLEELPIPEASGSQLREVAAMVSALRDGNGSPRGALETEAALDAAISELFGVKEVPR